MNIVAMPEDSVEHEGKVYRRQAWRGHRGFFALVPVGKMEDVVLEGKATGQRTFVPLRAGSTFVNPLKASKKSMGK